MSSLVIFFKSVFEAIKTLLGLLFLKLHLWLPAIYLLMLFILSAVYPDGVRLNAPAIITAVVLSFVLAGLLAFRSYYKKKYFPEDGEKRVRRKISDERVLITDGENISGSAVSEKNEAGKSASEPRLFFSKNPAPDVSETSAVNMEEPAAAAQKETAATLLDSSSVPPFAQKAGQSFSESLRKPSPEPTLDTPRYLRTRRDPSLLLLEYSDRLEVYKKTINGLEYIATEYKQL